MLCICWCLNCEDIVSCVNQVCLILPCVASSTCCKRLSRICFRELLNLTTEKDLEVQVLSETTAARSISLGLLLVPIDYPLGCKSTAQRCACRALPPTACCVVRQACGVNSFQSNGIRPPCSIF